MEEEANHNAANWNRPLSRRAVLGLGGHAFALVVLGGAVRWVDGQDAFLRPPGALTESAFLARCIKCGKCQEACPTGVISTLRLDDSLRGAGSPTLDFRLGYCNLCLDCIDVCPTGALMPVTTETVRLGVARVEHERCIAWNWRGCTECFDACPGQAVTLDENQRRPAIDAVRCNGCGLCEYVCPSPSVRGYGGSEGKGIVVVPGMDARA